MFWSKRELCARIDMGESNGYHTSRTMALQVPSGVTAILLSRTYSPRYDLADRYEQPCEIVTTLPSIFSEYFICPNKSKVPKTSFFYVIENNKMSINLKLKINSIRMLIHANNNVREWLFLYVLNPFELSDETSIALLFCFPVPGTISHVRLITKLRNPSQLLNNKKMNRVLRGKKSEIHIYFPIKVVWEAIRSLRSRGSSISESSNKPLAAPRGMPAADMRSPRPLFSKPLDAVRYCNVSPLSIDDPGVVNPVSHGKADKEISWNKEPMLEDEELGTDRRTSDKVTRVWSLKGTYNDVKEERGEEDLLLPDADDVKRKKERKEEKKNSFVFCGWTTSAFRHHPVDVLARILNVASLAVDAILCIDLKALSRSVFQRHKLINTCEQSE
ncbi:hypothetical protein C0J52_25352 [Blattella germanica]|nr:hypothetical protein C0J52_25352 [Blattella germanica]